MKARAGRGVALAFACALGTVACGPDYGGLIDALAAGDRDAGRELLLAKGEAVGPLLEAFDDPRRGAARPYLVSVLFSLRQRLADPAIEEALLRHLREDGDPRVRALIAGGLAASGIGGVDDLLAAAADPAPAVRRAALESLSAREDEIEPPQRERLEGLLPRLLRDEDGGVRAEALLRAEDTVRRMVDGAGRYVAQADLAAAESLYTAARDFSPDSWMAKFRQARFYYDHGDRERGLALMRSHGMVLDVPRTSGSPRLDGLLDEPFWERAARVPLGYKTNYFTAAPSDLETDLYIVAAEDALYIGVRAADARTDSLVAHRTARDDHIWLEDSIELFFDANLDRRSYVQFILSSLGTVFDAVHEDGIGTQQREWTAADSLATRVGKDFWSLEYRVEYDERWVPRPETGAVWGSNFVRDYRDLVNYSQWIYTYRTVHQPDVFGLLVFE